MLEYDWLKVFNSKIKDDKCCSNIVYFRISRFYCRHRYEYLAAFRCKILKHSVLIDGHIIPIL